MRPRHKTPRAVSQSRMDGWINAITALGLAGRDKTLGAKFQSVKISDEEAEELWSGDDMAAKAIELVPAEMMRQGFEIKLDTDGSDAETDKQTDSLLKAKLSELCVVEKFIEVMEYERAYGGGGIFLGANDGSQDLKLPLIEEKVLEVSYLNVFERRELIPVTWYADGQSKRFGDPMTFRVQASVVGSSDSSFNNAEIHESRFLLFRGKRISRRRMQQNQGWGESVLTRVQRVLSQFGQTWQGAAVLLADFAQAVIRIKGLAQLLAANKEQAVVNRAVAVDLARSIARAVILDSEESYERTPTPLAGFPDMLDRFALRMAAAMDMPVSRLMGQAPAGLQATGDSDIRWWYDRIKTDQVRKVTPKLEQLLRIIFKSIQGPTNGQEPKNWTIIYTPLWQPTEVESAEIRFKTAQADALMVTGGVLSPDEVANSRYGGDGYSTDTTLDKGVRDLAQQLHSIPDDPQTQADPVTQKAPEVTITPTDLAAIVTVNQALIKAGYPPKPPGDPDGEITVLQFKAKNENLTAAAATAAASGATSEPPVAVPSPTPATT